MELLESVKKLMLAGLGVPEKLKEMVDDLVKRGELSESQGSKLVKEWADRAEKGSADLSNSISEAVNKALEKMNMPTRDEVDALKEEIKNLSEKIQEQDK